MSDRLAELRRQRALLQQHVEWLEREIAAEQAKPAPVRAAEKASAAAMTAPDAPLSATIVKTTTISVLPSPFAPAAPAATAVAAQASTANPDADRILEEYRTAPNSLHSDVRKGCLLYFVAALALFVGVIALLYFTLSRR